MPDAGASTQRTARLLYPYQMVRGVTQAFTCPMYAGASLDAPTSGTVSVLRPNGTALVDEAAISITASIPTISISSAILVSTESLGPRWQFLWTLNYADGTTEIVRQDAVLVRRAIHPTVTDQVLYRRVSVLNPDAPGCIHTETTFLDKRDEAWGEILRRIFAKGQRPDLIVEISALHGCQLNLTLALIYEDFETSLNVATFGEIAARYRAAYEDAWASLSYAVDADDAGTTTGRRRTSGSVWCGGFPNLT